MLLGVPCVAMCVARVPLLLVAFSDSLLLVTVLGGVT